MGRWGCLAANRREHAQQYYQYLQAHQETMQQADTWHVQWISLAWLWGFVIALVLVLLLWIWQYRSTRQKAGMYPVDSFGGYTTELAGRATSSSSCCSRSSSAWAGARRRAHRLGAEVLMAAESLPPLAVRRRHREHGRVPAADWPLVFGSMQALKGHVQEYPGCQKLEAFVEPAKGRLRIHCYTAGTRRSSSRPSSSAATPSSACSPTSRGIAGRAAPLDGEDLLMAEATAQRPARPLVGYRDVGGDIRHSRPQMVRAWIILARPRRCSTSAGR